MYANDLPDQHASRLRSISILHWLRSKNRLTLPYYLHIHQGAVEIGWQAQQQVVCLNGEAEGQQDWVAILKHLSQQAADQGNKLFGYIGFDAWDRVQGLAPDKSAAFPLVQFFMPAHRLSITADRVDYVGEDATILPLVLQAPPCLPEFDFRPRVPDVEFSQEAFIKAVSTAKTFLSEDITKVVLSRYLGFDYDGDLLTLFSEYCGRQRYTDAILMDFGSVGAVIASPELFININQGNITANPLAGTRIVGKDAEENRRIAKQLLSDRKELAEHTLALVQMLRELGPYCEPDSLVVNRLLEVVQHNQIMHLSSTIRGQLRTDQDCLDAALSLFPSSMVSGVPKSPAIALLRQVEPFPRGLFAGTVGWISGRNCRLILTIRGMYKYGPRLFVQAGAGVMAESDPARENAEVEMKMAPMLATLGGDGY
jgi:anthranilate/para-aminobenzoate synthase component I